MEISASFISLFILYLYFVSKNAVEASHDVFTQLQSKPAVDVKRAGRTGYHFQPPKNWINDPNGPMYYNGIYHLFYQYNPKGAVWGNIVWAHSISRDLINWQKLEKAIYPSSPSDKYGCWSGSTTIIGNKYPIILYTGIIDRSNTQVQNYAIPADLSDPYLRKWVKPANNTVIKADNYVNKTSFRDPTTAWVGLDGLWRISVGGRFNDTGIAHLYLSRDFKHWTKADHYLHSVEGTGNFECPDFYPVLVNGTNGLDTSVNRPGVKHVLKVSLDATRYEYYTIGTYDQRTDRYVTDKGMIDGWKGLRYDYGNFYASKSFYDPSKRRRILWGWANESDSTADDIAKGWAGIQLIPRTILLDPNGLQLRLWPVQEVESLRRNVVELSNIKLTTGESIEINGTTPAQADVEVTFSFKNLGKAEKFDQSWDPYDAQKVCSQKGATVQGGLGPFGLLTLASKNLTEYTPVFFRVFRDGATHRVLMCSDASRSTLENGVGAYRPSFAGFVNADLGSYKISLRSLIDNSVVESFGAEGRTCISSRVYPTIAIQSNAHLYAFNNGIEDVKIDSLKAWSMNSPRNMNQ